MKRIDKEITNQSLIKMIKDDIIERNQELLNFISLLGRVEGGFSFFLDTEWGQGKTIFVKQLVLLLNALNNNLSHLALSDAESNIIKNILPTTSEPELYLPVYYNAWENDYWSDPLPTIVASIANTIGEDFSAKEPSPTSEKICATIDAILKPFNLDSASTIKEAFTAKDLFSLYKERQLTREKIGEFVEDILHERANKLFLVIDELDRCRPDFALRVLEETKNLFYSDNVIVLYSVNANELAHVVEGAYGSDLDGNLYLSRFYDLKIGLREVSSKVYLHKLGIPDNHNHFDSTSIQISNVLCLTLRDLDLFFKKIDLISARVKETKCDGMCPFVYYSLVPILIAIGIKNPKLYKDISEGKEYHELCSMIQQCDSAMRLLNKCINSEANDNKNKSDINDLEQITTIISSCLELMWGDEYTEKHKEALQLLSFDFGDEYLFKYAANLII